MSSVRAELALALESRGHCAAAVARGVEEVALALGIDALLDRSTPRALRGREAASRARRGAGGQAEGGAAGRADLAAGPRRRRRADRSAAAAERGVGDDDRARRAPLGALPRGFRSCDLAGSRPCGPRWRSQIVLEMGGATRANTADAGREAVRVGRVASGADGREAGARDAALTRSVARGGGLRAGGPVPGSHLPCDPRPGGSSDRRGGGRPGPRRCFPSGGTCAWSERDPRT